VKFLDLSGKCEPIQISLLCKPKVRVLEIFELSLLLKISETVRIVIDPRLSCAEGGADVVMILLPLKLRMAISPKPSHANRTRR
jgi:hypothetical protein